MRMKPRPSDPRNGRGRRASTALARQARAVLLCLLICMSAISVQPAQAADEDIRLTIRTPSYTLDAGGLVVPGFATNDVPGAPSLPSGLPSSSCRRMQTGL